MKIAITGATGFIGDALLSYLKKKENITVVQFDKKKHSILKQKTLERLVKNCDIVYHLAGINDPEHSKLFKTNVTGTLNIFEAVKNTANPSCRVIFSSSFSVYKIPTKLNIVDEKFTTQPTNHYGLSKLLAEYVCKYYSTTYSVPTAILRISNPYGPRMRPYKKGSVIPTFIDLAKKGRSVTINGNGKQTRDFIYISDVISALWKARKMKFTMPYVLINICSGEKTSINDLITLIEKKINKKIVTEYKKNAIVHEDWLTNNSYAQKALSWKPKVNLESGLELMLQSANNNK